MGVNCVQLMHEKDICKDMKYSEMVCVIRKSQNDASQNMV